MTIIVIRKPGIQEIKESFRVKVRMPVWVIDKKVEVKYFWTNGITHQPNGRLNPDPLKVLSLLRSNCIRDGGGLERFQLICRQNFSASNLA
jgi:hypothetical protein